MKWLMNKIQLLMFQIYDPNHLHTHPLRARERQLNLARKRGIFQGASLMKHLV